MTGNGKVPIVNGLSYGKIEQRAELLIKRHYPELLVRPGLFPLLDFFEFTLPEVYQIDTWVREDLPPGVEGITTPGDEDHGPYVEIPSWVYEALERDAPRARFTTGHEIGHAVLHVNQLRTRIVSGTFSGLHRDSTIATYCHPEWQADAFAGAILAPAAAMAIAVRTHGKNVASLADLFGVSQASMTIRLGVLQRLGRI